MMFNLTGDEAARAEVVLKKKNERLESHECDESGAPSAVGLDPHEVVWAPEYVERHGEASQSHSHDVVRVQRLPRVSHHVRHYLRHPERVHHHDDESQVVVELVHHQNASQENPV